MTARPLQVAVVGAGPAGMYAIEHLLDDLAMAAVEIDLFDRLATPWGLVRSGVAPDHPEKRLVIDRLFAHLFSDSRVRFIGNVHVGRDVGHDMLSAAYDAVVYASGATGERRLGVPGENLANCLSAGELVGFYNGHPDHRDVAIDLNGQRAVVVGNGNVALDVARLLVRPSGDLERTDIADAALAKLRVSRIAEVVVMGRRGPLQAAFANAELEELEGLAGVDVIVDGRGLPAEVDRIDDPSLRRKMRTLRRLAERPATSGNKRIVLRFLASPVRFAGGARVERVEVMTNRLIEPRHGQGSEARSVATGRSFLLEADLVIQATGFSATPVPGVSFDEVRGVFRHERGRVVASDGSLRVGTYVTGWAKRGCRGVIGSNRQDSGETIGSLVEDATNRRLRPPTVSRESVLDAVRRSVRTVSRDGWSSIDRVEREAGRVQGRPRVKITDPAVHLRLATTDHGASQ